MVEEGLNQLPYTECTVTTPTGTWETTPGSGTDVKIHGITPEVEGTQGIIESNSLLLRELLKTELCIIQLVFELWQTWCHKHFPGEPRAQSECPCWFKKLQGT